MTQQADESTFRLYFALWPGGRVRRALADFAADWQRQARARLLVVPAERLHLTLVFIGAVEGEGGVQRCIAAGRGVRSGGFSLCLDQPGHFGRGRRRHVWLGPRACPPGLSVLQQQLRSALQGAGLAIDTGDFVPHVTLLRGGRPGPAPPVAIGWPVRDFVLVNSRQEEGRVCYEVLHRFGLRDGGGLP